MMMVNGELIQRRRWQSSSPTAMVIGEIIQRYKAQATQCLAHTYNDAKS
jgi:hypothetical protein